MKEDNDCFKIELFFNFMEEEIRVKEVNVVFCVEYDNFKIVFLVEFKEEEECIKISLVDLCFD